MPTPCGLRVEGWVVVVWLGSGWFGSGWLFGCGVRGKAIDLVLEVDVINILQRHFTVIETGVCWPSLHSGIILISIWRLHSGSGSSLLTFPPALHYFHHSKSGPKSLERIHTAIAFPKLRIPVSREGCRTEIHVVLRSGR